LFRCGTVGFLRLASKAFRPDEVPERAAAFMARFSRDPRFSTFGITVAQHQCRRMKVMTAILAVGAGLIMTAVAVAIAGLVIEFTLLALSRAFATASGNPINEQKARPVVIQFKNSENNIGTVEWAEEAA
jgi:hypothetical protein